MARDEVEVVVVGGGAAGIAAGRRLVDSGIDCLILEARTRLGGRSWTVVEGGHAIDLGCGWLHSGDRNPWREVAEAQGRAIDRTPPPWMRPSMPVGFPLDEQKAFVAALRDFHERLGAFPEEQADVAADSFLPPGGRWNALISAVGTYLSGAELDTVSVRDFARYEDTGVNWRVVDGYGAVIAAHAAGVPARLGTRVEAIDRRGAQLKVVTGAGTITARAVIVTLPSDLIAAEAIRHTPPLPQKAEAAAGLPLGLADKLFLSLSGAEAFETDSRLFGRTNRSATGAYHFRPFGRPQIEAYFGGSLAAELERGGEAAFLDFARSELTALLGNDFARRIAPLRLHAWGADPLARGSYSRALPGQADCRKVLAEPVEDRLFFAGEACSVHDFSTAHGAYRTGVAAADQAIAALGRGRRSR